MAWRRTEAALALALACGCAGPHRAAEQADVGHHHVRFERPEGWEHLDHGREQLLRSGEAQLTLVDLGPASAEAMAHELEGARTLWLAGRRLDAFERVRELRSPMLSYASDDQRSAFWRPWNEVVDMPAPADSGAIGPAFASLIRSTSRFEQPSPDLLFQYVSDRSLHGHDQEIASRSRRTVHGNEWVVFELWNRVSHGARSRVAFTVDDGYLLALTMDRGVYEQLSPAFESVLASLELGAEPGPAR